MTVFSITDAMIEPLTTSINNGLTTMMPIGIGIMASFLGINIIKRVVYSFL